MGGVTVQFFIFFEGSRNMRIIVISRTDDLVTSIDGYDTGYWRRGLCVDGVNVD